MAEAVIKITKSGGQPLQPVISITRDSRQPDWPAQEAAPVAARSVPAAAPPAAPAPSAPPVTPPLSGAPAIGTGPSPGLADLFARPQPAVPGEGARLPAPSAPLPRPQPFGTGIPPAAPVPLAPPPQHIPAAPTRGDVPLSRVARIPPPVKGPDLARPPDTGLTAGLRDRTQGLLEAGVRGTGTLAESFGDFLERETGLSGLTEEQLAERQLQPVFDLADYLGDLRAINNYRATADWAQVKRDITNLPRYIVEQSVRSIPDMAALVAALPAYVVARATELGEERARNSGRETVASEDIAAALPFALLSAALDRISLSVVAGAAIGRNKAARILGEAFDTRAKRIGAAAVAESATEASQEAIEYWGETLGTPVNPEMAQALDRMAAAAVVGGPLGAAIRGGVEAPGALIERLSRGGAVAQPETPPIVPPERPAPEAPAAQPAPTAGEAAPEVGEPLLSPVDLPEIPTQSRAATVTTQIETADGPISVTFPDDPHRQLFELGQALQAGTLSDQEIAERSQALWQDFGGFVEHDPETGANFRGPQDVPDLARIYIDEAEASEGDTLIAVTDPDERSRFLSTLATQDAPLAGVEPRAAPVAPVAPVLPEAPAAPAPAPAPVAPTPVAARQTLRGGEGTEIEADPVLMEAAEVVTSDQPGFPAELQPRQRERAASQAQVAQIAANLEPDLLGLTPSIDTGAPIIGPDAIVESGNARVMALRQAYARGLPGAEAYRQWLASQGYDTAGFTAPVLVRRRATELTPEARQDFVIRANQPAVARFTAAEQAQADARLLDKPLMALLRQGLIEGAANRPFVRKFIEGVATPAEAVTLIDAEGALSSEGIRRINNALFARAYGDADLINQVTESADPDMKGVVGALTDLAGPWAAFRDRVRAGEIPAELDITDFLLEAIGRVRTLRERGGTLGDALAQADMFSAMDPATQRIMRAFYRPNQKQLAGRQAVADLLRFYVDEAGKASTQPTLVPLPEVPPSEILETGLQRREARGPSQTQLDLGAAGPGPRGPAGREEARAPGAGARRPAARGRGRPAEPEASATPPAEAVRRAKRPKSKRKPGPLGQRRVRPVDVSPYDQVFLEAGLDPADARLLPIEQQFTAARQQVQKVYGFRSIAKDADLNAREAVDALMDAYVNLRAMAAIMGLPPSSMSLDGKLGLELKRGSPGKLAYYQPSKTDPVIGMVRRNDAFAHEWGHALDWDLAFQVGYDYHVPKGRGLSGKIRSGAPATDLDQNVKDAFADLMNAMFFDEAKLANRVRQLEHQLERATAPSRQKQIQATLDRVRGGGSKLQGVGSSYYANAKSMDQGGFEGGSKKGYWQRPTELLARSFEAYVAAKTEANGGRQEFISRENMVYRDEASAFMQKAYPQGAEREGIFEAWDRVIQTLRDRQLIPGRGEAAALPDYDLTKSMYWSTYTGGTPTPQIGVWQGLERAQRRDAQMERKLAERETRKAQQRAERRKARMGKDASLMRDMALRTLEAGEDMTAGWLMTIRGHMLAMERRYPQSGAVKQLRAWFATDPGARRLTERTYEEQIRQRSRQRASQLRRIVTTHDIDTWDADKSRALRDLLVDDTGQAVEDAPADIKAAAADLRTYLDQEYFYNQRNGVNIGYTKNGYLPRVPDMDKVDQDLEGFRRQAQIVYGEVFDRDVGEWPDTDMDQFMRYAYELTEPGEAVREEIRAVRGALSKIARLEENPGDDPDIAADKIADLNEELESIMPDLYGEIRERFAQGATADWEARLRGIKAAPAFQFESRGPAGRYTKSRVLPESADRHMGDFLITDPEELISTYTMQSTRRAAFAAHFGNETEGRAMGWRLDDAMAQLRSDGVHSADIDELTRAVEMMIGRMRPNITPRGLRWRSRIQAIYMPVLLARSLMSQLAEPVTIGLRSGRPVDMVKPFLSQLGDLLNAAKIAPKSTQERARWRREMGEFLGVTADYLADEIMSNRFNMLYQSAADTQRMSKFFNMIGVHPHAMSMRRAALDVGFKYARRIAERATGTGKAATDAKGALRELGIDPDNKALVDFLAVLPDRPSIQSLNESPYTDQIMTALNRFVDESVVDPKIADKPALATQPEFAFMYGILAFQSAFQRQVLIRSAKNIKSAFEAGTGTRMLAVTLTGFATLAALQAGAYVLRTAMWGDTEKLEDKPLEDWILEIASRTGLFGLADPLVNAVTGIKYQRDLTQITAGPIPAFVLFAAQQIAAGQFRNSPNTNTAERNTVKGFWDLAVAPTVIWNVTRWVPNHWLANLFGWALVTTVGSGTVKEMAAEQIAGPKAESRGKGGIKVTR